VLFFKFILSELRVRNQIMNGFSDTP
jgi:hypothetical protein